MTLSGSANMLDLPSRRENLISPDVSLIRHEGSYNNQLLLAAFPEGQSFTTFYDRFASCLASRLDTLNLKSHACLYTTSQLHVTVAALHPSRIPSQDLSTCASVWTNALKDSFRLESSCDSDVEKNRRTGSFENRIILRLRDGTVFDDGVGVFLWEDASAAFTQWRSNVRQICQQPDLTAKLAEAGSKTDAVRLPNIVHSTVLRWKSSPKASVHDVQKVFVDTFWEQLNAHKEDVLFEVKTVGLVEEKAPCLEKSTIHYNFRL